MNNHRTRQCCQPAVLLAACCLLTGCGDCFRGWDCMDYTVDEDRLRQIEPLDLNSVSAPPPAAPTSQPAQAKPPPRAELTLAQCRAQALAGNLGLKVELLNPTIAAESVTEAEAQFEAMLYADLSHSKTDTPTDSALSSAAAESTSVTPGLRLPLRTGGSVELALPTNRFQTNNAFSTLNPSYSADLSVSITQPLLRGGGVRTNTHAIRVAKWARQQADALAKLEVIRVLAVVDRLYWRLYAARGELAVRKQEHELAKAQLARARRQVEAGIKPEVEIVRAQLGVAEGVEAIIIADNAVRDRQRDLKRLLQMPGMGMDSPTVIVPVTPPSVARYRLQADKLIEMAAANRMELLELELQLARDASEIDFQRNQALPLLTAAYTYNVNGLGRSVPDALELTCQKRFEDHYLGLQFELPLGNEAARSRLRRAVLTRIQHLATRRRRRSLIEQEVRNSIDSLDAAWQRIIASRDRVLLADRLRRAEQRQFDLGLRTSTEVLAAQTSLADAQSAEIRALVEYQAAQVDLAVATGAMLGAARVRWEPVRKMGQEPFSRRSGDGPAGRGRFESKVKGHAIGERGS